MYCRLNIEIHISHFPLACEVVLGIKKELAHFKQKSSATEEFKLALKLGCTGRFVVTARSVSFFLITENIIDPLSIGQVVFSFFCRKY